MFREYERKVRNPGAKRKYDFATVDREELCYHSRPEKANFRSSSFPLRKYILVLFEIVSIKICDSTYIISPAPKVPVSILVLQASIPLEYYHRTLTFQVSHKR